LFYSAALNEIPFKELSAIDDHQTLTQPSSITVIRHPSLNTYPSNIKLRASAPLLTIFSSNSIVFPRILSTFEVHKGKAFNSEFI